jgi:hypothetical protein
VWPRRDRPVLPHGPFVMPQFHEGPLPRRLLAAWLRGFEAGPEPVLPMRSAG